MAASTSSAAANAPAPSANPPSIEAAYKRKCIALKHRLNEIESENDAMRLRIVRGKRHVQKQRLETAMLLHRVAVLMGMVNEKAEGGPGADPETLAKAQAILNGAEAKAGASGQGTAMTVMDESDGSMADEPPSPQERPLRSKRSHATMRGGAGSSANQASATPSGRRNSAGPQSSTRSHNESPAPSQDQLQSSFRINTNVGSARQSSHANAISPSTSTRRESKSAARNTSHTDDPREESYS